MTAVPNALVDQRKWQLRTVLEISPMTYVFSILTRKTRTWRVRQNISPLTRVTEDDMVAEDSSQVVVLATPEVLITSLLCSFRCRCLDWRRGDLDDRAALSQKPRYPYWFEILMI